MARRHLLALLLVAALGAARAADGFVPPPPLPSPPPYPTTTSPYQQQARPEPTRPEPTPTPAPAPVAGDANRPYLGFGVQYPMNGQLPGLELIAPRSLCKSCWSRPLSC